VLFLQDRYGLDGQAFRILKFRSMRCLEAGDPPGLRQASRNDPRVTPVGAFLRRWSLDELPQLFNVLLGDMSLVGNRPLPLYEAEKLTQDDWVARFAAPAGITGLWQVTERGKANVSEDGRKKLDIEYARRYSLWLDLWILGRTLPAAIQKVQV
jgi:lipopolysaccharide/colanic/teichoic acid biosynthesis glycosyltransferase